MTTTVGLVALEGLAVLGQYDPDERWNGWLCPSLDALAVVKVLDTLNGIEPAYGYQFAHGVLYLDDLQEPGSPAELIEADDDGLYRLGAHAWTWSVADDLAEPLTRRLSAVPDLADIVCMFADTGNGPCGGQTTQVGDGRDYCMNHAGSRLPRR